MELHHCAIVSDTSCNFGARRLNNVKEHHTSTFSNALQLTILNRCTDICRSKAQLQRLGFVEGGFVFNIHRHLSNLKHLDENNAHIGRPRIDHSDVENRAHNGRTRAPKNYWMHLHL